MDSIVNESMRRFEKLSQKHEKKIVIDLGVDRIVQFISTSAIGLLAIPTIIFAIIGPVLTCNPPTRCGNDAKSDFTDSFCWGSSSQMNRQCSLRLPLNNTQLTDEHKDVKFFYGSFPYLLIAQILMFMLSWSYWHFSMGSRLTGEIKFMKWFLKEMFLKLKNIERGRYDENEPFDEGSTSFNGKERYVHPETEPHDEEEPEISHSYYNEKIKVKKEATLITVQTIIEECSSMEKPVESRWEKIERKLMNFLNGSMRDRHLLSMLCYENFVSLEYFPYILSVFQASSFGCLNQYVEPQINNYSMMACILYQRCHLKNFSNIRLTTVYFTKQIFTSFMALANLAYLLTWYFNDLHDDDNLQPSLYRCFLPNEGICVVCKIHRKREMFFFFWLDIVLLLAIFSLSTYHWYNTSRNSNHLAMCHYFDRIMQTIHLAFESANTCIRNQKAGVLEEIKRRFGNNTILIDTSVIDTPEFRAILNLFRS